MMKQLRYLPIIVFSLVLALPVAAQDKKAKPDFSGNWVLTKSENVQDKIFKPKPLLKNPTVREVIQLRIEHADPELRLIEAVTTENLDSQGKVATKTEAVASPRSYYTDKRGEKNSLSSRTKWDGNNIVIGIIDEKSRINTVLKFSLSKDKKGLTVFTMKFSVRYDPVSRRDHVFPLDGGIKVYVKQ